MKTTIKKSLQSLLFVPMLALGVSTITPILQPIEAHAQGSGSGMGGSGGSSSSSSSGVSGGIRGGVDDAAPESRQEKGLFAQDGIFQTIVNTLLFIIGAVAVIMLVYGGFKYVISGGDSSAVTSAKNTILYAVVGIVVALLSWAVLDFVLKQLGS